MTCSDETFAWRARHVANGGARLVVSLPRGVRVRHAERVVARVRAVLPGRADRRAGVPVGAPGQCRSLGALLSVNCF